MRLLPAGDVPLGRVRYTARYSPVIPFFVLAAAVGIPLALLPHARPVLSAVPLWAVVLAAPLLLLVALVGGTVYVHLANLLFSCLRPGNWVLRTVEDGVYLNLRSYLNHHLAEDGPTVAYLDFAEIATAGKRVETLEAPLGEDAPTKTYAYLELHTRPATGTEELREAVAREREAPAPERSFLGVRTSGRARHSPVQVPDPGVVLVEWRGRGMLRALAEHVESVARRDVALGHASEKSANEDKILELVERGANIDAVRLTRSTYGVNFDEACAFVESLRDRAA